MHHWSSEHNGLKPSKDHRNLLVSGTLVPDTKFWYIGKRPSVPPAEVGSIKVPRKGIKLKLEFLWWSDGKEVLPHMVFHGFRNYRLSLHEIMICLKTENKV